MLVFVPASIAVRSIVDLHAAIVVLAIPVCFLVIGVVGMAEPGSTSIPRLVAWFGAVHVVGLGLSALAWRADAVVEAGLLHAASQIFYGSGFALLVLIAAVFPSNRLDSTRWRSVCGAAFGVALLLPLFGGFAGPSPAVLQPDDGDELGPISAVFPDWIASAGGVVLLLPLLATVIFAVRYRSSDPNVRMRMRWPIMATLVIGLLAGSAVALKSAFPASGDAVFLIVAPVLPLSLILGSRPRSGAAVDRALRATSVFGSTWLLAAAAYGIGAAASAMAASSRSLVATALVAAVVSITLAAPIRRRLLALADDRSRLEVDLADQIHKLRRQTVELELSRRRLATAADEERRRVERYLHDGVQQELVALIARIESARTIASFVDGDARSRNELDLAATLAAGAYETVRRLSHGIRPAVLEDRGLVDAIAGRAEISTVPVDVEVSASLDGLRWPPEVEGAAYFFTQEALTNVLKHASATRVVVSVAYESDLLAVEVRDNGCGGLDPDLGTGIRGLHDRIEALGGAVRMTEFDGWTRIRAEIQTQVEES